MGGGGGGKIPGMGGGGKGQDTAGTGVTPDQMALAEYTFGQGALKDNATFSGMGLGDSTMNTQAIGGSRFAEAKNLADMSHKDAAAQAAFNQQQASALESLAGQAGQAFGAGGGGGGGGGFSTAG